jgi:hypothetical protein
MTEEMVTISKEYFERLRHAYDLLMALQESGVDNWEGYSEAMSLIENLEED